MDLPPQRASRITKLNSTIGNRIEKFGSTYIGSFCYEGCTYSLFNPTSLTTAPLERMTKANKGTDYSRKEEFIGIDSQGRMILNVKIIPEDSKSQQHFKTEMIAAVSLVDENKTIDLLKPSDLPEEIYQYFMVNGIDKILMIGKDKTYIYDLNQNIFRELQIDTQLNEILSSRKNIMSKINNSICFTDISDNEALDKKEVIYAIDIKTETYLSPTQNDCKGAFYHKSNDYNEMFKELNLPDNFELVYNPVVYKTYSIVKGIPESELPENSEIIN